MTNCLRRDMMSKHIREFSLLGSEVTRRPIDATVGKGHTLALNSAALQNPLPCAVLVTPRVMLLYLPPIIMLATLSLKPEHGSAFRILLRYNNFQRHTEADSANSQHLQRWLVYRNLKLYEG